VLLGAVPTTAVHEGPLATAQAEIRSNADSVQTSATASPSVTAAGQALLQSATAFFSALIPSSPEIGTVSSQPVAAAPLAALQRIFAARIDAPDPDAPGSARLSIFFATS
jgi:hypothetical protein